MESQSSLKLNTNLSKPIKENEEQPNVESTDAANSASATLNVEEPEKVAINVPESDEDLDALMKENGIGDEPEVVETPKEEAKQTIRPKPKPDSEKKKTTTDSLDDLSDEDLDKLMKENGLFE